MNKRDLSQTVQDKQTLTLTAKVSGKPMPTVKWFKWVILNMCINADYLVKIRQCWLIMLA